MGWEKTPGINRSEGESSDPKSPRAVPAPLPASIAGGGGEGAAGSREAEPPGPGLRVCPARFGTFSKIIIQITPIESKPARTGLFVSHRSGGKYLAKPRLFYYVLVSVCLVVCFFFYFFF